MTLALARRLALVLCLIPVGITAQDSADFWREYTAAAEDKASGFGKKKRLVENNKARLQDHISYQLWTIGDSFASEAFEDAEKRIELIQDVAQIYKIAYRTSALEKRAAFAKTLNSDTGPKYVAARKDWNKWLTMHAKPQKGPGEVEDLIMLGNNTIAVFEEIGELYTLAEVAEWTGNYCKIKEDWAETARLYEKARDGYRAHRRKGHENRVAVELTKLAKEHNVGPEAKKDDPAKPKKVRPEPKKFPAVALKYKKAKAVDALPTGFKENAADSMLWFGVTIEKDKPLDWPLGSGAKFHWEGGTKFFLEPAGGKKKRIKPGAGKAKAVDLTVADGDDKWKYRAFMQLLGEQEKFLGYEANMALATRVTVKIARACYTEGAFNGIKLALIDDNINGKFNDFGNDLVRIGKDDVQPLSPYMSIGGTLYKVVEVRPDGTGITFAEYVGDTGTLQVKWTGGRRVQPQQLIFKCIRGEFEGGWFNVADGQPKKVPDGFYQFQHGYVTKGSGRKEMSVTIEQGNSESFDVAEGETVVKQMGGPFQIRAELTKSGGKVMLEGERVFVMGALEEQYKWFYPVGYTPKVWLRKKEGAVVVKGHQMRRPDQEEFNKNYNAPWYPKSIDVKASTDAEYEFKATMTNPLLGTIKTDWIETRFAPTP